MAGESPLDDKTLGRTAVALGLLDPDEVGHALAVAAEQPARAPGAIFLERGLLTQAQLDYITAAYRFRQTRQADWHLGERVIDRGWATAEQIDELLQEQKRLFVHQRKRILLGELLVQNGILSAEQRDQLLTGEHAPPAEALAGDVAVHVSDDNLCATVVPGPGPRPTREALDLALRRQGISVGVDHAAIAALCDGTRPTGEPVVVARGTPAQPGRDAEIEYLFETHPLGAGRQNADGTIDFRDRGELPQVSAGTPLARKTPAQPGAPGRDLFGRVINVRKPQDRRLLLGNGVALAEDQLTVVATTDGLPSLSATGKIAVLPEYRVEGDVDYHTGHIEFAGHVVVTGTIRNGFHVKCGQLTAGEAEGAEIIAKGDVLIRGGLINTHLHTEGAATAKYLHSTTLEALGDVGVEREVVESRVECGGAFHGEHCTLLGSRIAAKQGINVKTVGSESSAPCQLVFGVDERVQHELQHLTAERTEQCQAVEAAGAQLVEHQRQREALEAAIGELAQQQDQAMVRQRALSQGGAGAELTAVEAVIRSLADQVDALFAQQERVLADADEARARQASAQAAIAELDGELAAINDWAQAHPGTPELRVSGTLHAGTVLETPHVEARTRGERKRIWLREREVISEDGHPEWRMEPFS